MAVNALPLLHKYVLSPQDDKDLTLAKLRYRLCVKEVCDVLLSRSLAKGCEPLQSAGVDDDSFCLNPTSKWEDSGIGTDESVSEDLRSPQRCDTFKLTEEQKSVDDISRQPDSFSEETFRPEASSPLSSSSSDSSNESEELENPYLYSKSGENFDNGENNGDHEFFENVYVERKENAAPTSISSRLGNQFESVHEEDEEIGKADFVPLVCSTLDSRIDQCCHHEPPLDKSPSPVSTIQGHDDDSNSFPKGVNVNDKCTDVSEALRILMTRSELPQIITRKAVVTWSSWNVADLVRGPQKMQTEEKGQQESQERRNPSKQLRATHEKILSKDKKLADIYRKIKERDEEDQRLVKELLKKQKIPYAEPLPAALPPPKPLPEQIENPKPQVEKEAVSTAKLKEGSSATRTLSRAEEPARKKKRGNVLQNVVHSLQRKFSKRNRETMTAS